MAPGARRTARTSRATVSSPRWGSARDACHQEDRDRRARTSRSHATSKSFFPLRWTASGHAGLFPALDADLEVAPIGPGRTQLAMSARYVPPFGAVGRTIDRALLSRVAEATVKDFLDRVAEAIMGERDRACPRHERVPVGPGRAG